MDLALWAYRLAETEHGDSATWAKIIQKLGAGTRLFEATQVTSIVGKQPGRTYPESSSGDGTNGNSCGERSL